MERYSHLIAALLEQLWAISDAKWQVIQALLEMRLSGDRLTEDEIRAAMGTDKQQAPERMMKAGSVAIIPVYGILAQRMNMFMQMSGGTSTQLLGRDIRAALEDPGVEAIVEDFDTPGGSIYGVEEVAALNRVGRAQKPIVGVVNSMAASGGYWLASGASEIVAAPDADVGSIGVFAVHRDMSKALEQEGVKLTVIKAGKYKAEGLPHEPLTDEVRARLQARVDAGLDSFITAVAKGRGMRESVVRNSYGEGQVFGAKRALAEGMVDRIATLDETVSRLSSPQGRRALMESAQARSIAFAATAQEPATATAQESRARDLRAEVLQLELDNLTRRSRS